MRKNYLEIKKEISAGCNLTEVDWCPWSRVSNMTVVEHIRVLHVWHIWTSPFLKCNGKIQAKEVVVMASFCPGSRCVGFGYFSAEEDSFLSAWL